MKYPILVLLIAALGTTAVGCGKTPGGVTLAAAPLAGPNAASITRPAGFTVASIADSVSSGLLALLVGDHAAYASVSSFASFKICNDTLVMTDTNGNTVAINGSTQHAGLGALSFSSANTGSATLATSLNIASGTAIKEIDITSAVNSTICPNMSSDAVAFDPGSGVVHITQNTAFKFKLATPLTVDGSAQTLSLLFGAIVNGMVNLASTTGLTNSSIQTVAVQGAAQ